jgi:hypothetical protein
LMLKASKVLRRRLQTILKFGIGRLNIIPYYK